MKQKIKVKLSSERDIPLLGFLWRWKVVTTRALHLKFFPKTSLVVAYHRLNRLERAGIIKGVSDERAQNFHWTLSKKGFEAIRSFLPALREEGFGSEHTRHDGLVSAFHLGEWLIDRPENVQLFSEQQLRRYATESLPSWVPSPEIHRPDGYWGIPSNEKIFPVGVEVELNQKASAFYQTVGDYYSEEQTVFRVLWLVELESQARSIQKQITKLVSYRGDIHNFVSADQFTKHGWSAKFCTGPESGKSIRDTLHLLMHREGSQPPVNSSSTLTTQHLLDARKSQARIAL
ncbi:MAG: hypothetical protein WCI18_02835 [Pseudomonadota bacterium]